MTGTTIPDTTDNGDDTTTVDSHAPDTTVTDPDTDTTDVEQDVEPETFPAKVVKDLRKENARYRERAQHADQLAKRLHTALVAQTGKLADPSDLPFDDTHLDDPAALDAAVTELLARKPHLKARRATGDVGQGTRGTAPADTDLIGLMRGGL